MKPNPEAFAEYVEVSNQMIVAYARARGISIEEAAKLLNEQPLKKTTSSGGTGTGH